MNLKIFGCVLLVTAFVGAGACFTGAMKKRVKSLEFFIELFEIFRMKIEYELTETPLLFQNVDTNSGIGLDFLSRCRELMNRGNELKCSWYRAIDEFSETLQLNKEDVSILKKFSDALGETDLVGQISNISLYRELLEANLVKAEKDIHDNSRVAMSCCTFAGLVITILLL